MVLFETVPKTLPFKVVPKNILFFEVELIFFSWNVHSSRGSKSVKHASAPIAISGF